MNGEMDRDNQDTDKHKSRREIKERINKKWIKRKSAKALLQSVTAFSTDC
jgi:hypothetical protein